MISQMLLCSPSLRVLASLPLNSTMLLQQTATGTMPHLIPNPQFLIPFYKVSCSYDFDAIFL
jgi:hypothetical protein